MMEKTITAVLCVLLLCTVAGAANSKKVDCLKCHLNYDRGKSVHPAVAMGCDSCHTAIDASVIPHRLTTKIPKGLSAEQPDLCYGCHDKGMFTKRVVHPALAMGCTVCHNPHVSNAASLLVDPVGRLCASCHETQSSGKHVLAELSPGDDHPLHSRTDPADTRRELSCISCHNPHSSDGAMLFVNGADSPAGLCSLCHTKISVRTTGR